MVHDVSLTVRRGEVHGLIGESGSGKTQTAFAVMRLLPDGGHVTGGSIVFEGKEIAHASEKEMTRLRGTQDRLHPAGADVEPGPGLHHRLASWSSRCGST